MPPARYIVPNAVTVLGLAFGLAAIAAAHQARYVDAAWLIVWAVFVDKLDGMIARKMNATSAFGTQLDSLADLLDFGLAPAFLVWTALSNTPELGFDRGAGKWLLAAAAAMWVFGAALRLARFNVMAEAPANVKVFLGVPTTLCAGLLAIWMLVVLKYLEPGAPLAAAEAFREPHLFDWRLSGAAWSWVLMALLLGGPLMVSNLRMRKLGLTKIRVFDILMVVGVLTGYASGFARVFPEYMAWWPTTWLLVFAVLGQVSTRARAT